MRFRASTAFSAVLCALLHVSKKQMHLFVCLLIVEMTQLADHGVTMAPNMQVCWSVLSRIKNDVACRWMNGVLDGRYDCAAANTGECSQ